MLQLHHWSIEIQQEVGRSLHMYCQNACSMNGWIGHRQDENYGHNGRWFSSRTIPLKISMVKGVWNPIKWSSGEWQMVFWAEWAGKTKVETYCAVNCPSVQIIWLSTEVLGKKIRNERSYIFRLEAWKRICRICQAVLQSARHFCFPHSSNGSKSAKTVSSCYNAENESELFVKSDTHILKALPTVKNVWYGMCAIVR